jgi:DNA-binding PadR family transcriptional regulator
VEGGAKSCESSPGYFDLLILNAIGNDEFHGLGIARCVEQITKGTFKVRPGSLFPALTA